MVRQIWPRPVARGLCSVRFRRKLICSSAGWFASFFPEDRKTALVVLGELQQASLDDWVRLFGERAHELRLLMAEIRVHVSPAIVKVPFTGTL